MTDPVPADESPDLEGRYDIGPPAGSAGTVEIYTGTDRRLDREVSIKILGKDLADDPERRAEFESAATAIAAAAHPNVLTIYDVGNLNGRPCVVTEQVVTTLADEMGHGPVGEERVAQVALDCLAALELAHSAGLVHGSIEPGAIAIGDDGSAKLGDFTSAPATSGADDLERLEPSPATDLRRLATTLSEALALSSPPSATSVAGIITRAASDAQDDRFTKASNFSSAIRGAADTTTVIPIEDDPTLDETTDEPVAAASLIERVRGRWGAIDASRRRRVVLVLLALVIVALLLVASIGDDDPPIPGAPGSEPSGQDGLPPEVPQRRGGG